MKRRDEDITEASNKFQDLKAQIGESEKEMGQKAK